jgi:hypothetical protein
MRGGCRRQRKKSKIKSTWLVSFSFLRKNLDNGECSHYPIKKYLRSHKSCKYTALMPTPGYVKPDLF